MPKRSLSRLREREEYELATAQIGANAPAYPPEQLKPAWACASAVASYDLLPQLC